MSYVDSYIEDYLLPTGIPQLKMCLLCNQMIVLIIPSAGVTHFHEKHRENVAIFELQYKLRISCGRLLGAQGLASNVDVKCMQILLSRPVNNLLGEWQPLIRRAHKRNLVYIRAIPAMNPAIGDDKDVEIGLRWNGVETIFEFHRKEEKAIFLHILYLINYMPMANFFVKCMVSQYYLMAYDMSLTPDERKQKVQAYLEARLPPLTAYKFADNASLHFVNLQTELEPQFFEFVCNQLQQLPQIVDEKGSRLDALISQLAYQLGCSSAGSVSISHRIVAPNPYKQRFSPY